MEYRQIGKSGLKVPVFSFGTGTFGGKEANRFNRHLSRGWCDAF